MGGEMKRMLFFHKKGKLKSGLQCQAGMGFWECRSHFIKSEKTKICGKGV